jgi:hypothetical protein
MDYSLATRTFLKSAQCRCDDCCPAKSPETLEVRDAGKHEANGVFERITPHRGSDHAVKYERRGIMNGSRVIFYVSLSKDTQGSCWSMVWKPAANENEMHHLYETSPRVNWSLFPPRDGWHVTPTGEGVDPPPTLFYDPDFHLERILPHIRPGDASHDKGYCLAETLGSQVYNPFIQDAAAYWSYVHTMQLGDREKISAALFQFIFADTDHIEANRSKVVQLLDVGNRSSADYTLTTGQFLKDAECRCSQCCLAKSPETVEVRGALHPEANGIFARTKPVGLSDDAVNYKKQGGTMNGSPANFFVTLSKCTQGSYWSMVWKPVANSLETHYLYETSTRVNWSLFPPRDGWCVSPNGEGIEPPPTLLYDPDFHLERIVPCVRPDEESPQDTEHYCLTDTLTDNYSYYELIQGAAAYWSYAHAMRLVDQEKICAALFQFIFADFDRIEVNRSKVVQLLDVGSRKEQCIVLELAVWKFLCTMRSPDNLKGILDMTEWCHHGWKIRKQETRHSNAFHIIISSVLPFLDSLVEPLPVGLAEPAHR